MSSFPNPYGNSDHVAAKQTPESSSLAAYVMTKVELGRRARDQEHGRKERWEEYTRLWRGYWDPKDKNSNSERSRIITPALQQAIEMTVAEMEETAFGRKAWFDIEDDLQDEEKQDALMTRDLLLEDFELSQAVKAVTDAFLMSSIYGTGIIKLIPRVREVPEIVDGEVVTKEKFVVELEAVRCDEFVIDPAARTIGESGFCAHDLLKPRHHILEQQAAGIYKKAFVTSWRGVSEKNTYGTSAGNIRDPDEDSVLITEYAGKVPGKFFGKQGTVEALVTVANETTVLKAVENPYFMKDRPYLSFQHDTVPGEFWGRGVAEKGYNPQKALDAEVRARMDALALTTAPMMGADITRLPRNPDLRTRPGKLFLTRGRPSEILEPVGFSPQGLALTFQQSGDLERMVQMGTGAMDSASPISQNRRNETASGMSMIQSGFIKRSKRTMRNVEYFLDDLIKKTVWRYVQFEPTRYPKDLKFKVNSTMGIMAKEVENNQLVQMLGYSPPESPAHGVVLQALFENAVSSEKVELQNAIKQMNQPPSEEEQKKKQMQEALQMRAMQAEVAETEAKAEKAQQEALLAKERANRERVLADLEDDKVEIDAANVAVSAENARVNRQKNQLMAKNKEDSSSNDANT